MLIPWWQLCLGVGFGGTPHLKYYMFSYKLNCINSVKLASFLRMHNVVIFLSEIFAWFRHVMNKYCKFFMKTTEKENHKMIHSKWLILLHCKWSKWKRQLFWTNDSWIIRSLKLYTWGLNYSMDVSFFTEWVQKTR